ncbi:MAG: PorT family protein [Saprospiraceae bacterium]|nr:PorT family protein [Saprospiraceae bacterium]
MQNRFFLAFIVLFLQGFAVSAQVSIKAGVNLASVAEDAVEENFAEQSSKSIVGFQAGLAFDLATESAFSLQPELLFIQKGGRVSYGFNDNNKVESRYYYNYVEVPVLAKLKFYNTERNTGLYLIAGPYAGLAVSGKVKTTLTVFGQSSTSEEDISFDNDDPDDRNRRLDWGFSFGGGIKFGQAYLDLRYNLGINNLLDQDADNQNDNKPYRRNRGVGLALGYAF